MTPKLTTTSTEGTAGPDSSKTAPFKLPLESGPSPHRTCKRFSSISHFTKQCILSYTADISFSCKLGGCLQEVLVKFC